MNYIEAIKALSEGKKIRRKSWKLGVFWKENERINQYQTQLIKHGTAKPGFDPATSSVESILAEDWEIVQEVPNYDALFNEIHNELDNRLIQFRKDLVEWIQQRLLNLQ